MPSIYDIKPAFQNLLRPIVRGLAGAGVTANQVTFTAVVLSFAAGGAILAWREAQWPLLCLPGVLFLRMGLNAIDGMLAREHNMKSNLGAFLNEVGDVVSDSAMYLPFAVIDGVHPWPVIAVVILAAVSEMTGVVAIQIDGVRHYEGPMGKSDRAFAFGLIALALGLGFHGYFWINLFLTVVMVALALTIYNRARKALRGAAAEH